MKYLITTTCQAFIFSDDISHFDFAKKICADLSLIKSAGFVHIRAGKIETFGKSESLNISSQPEDSEILNTYLAERTK